MKKCGPPCASPIQASHLLVGYTLQQLFLVFLTENLTGRGPDGQGERPKKGVLKMGMGEVFC
jgi:hypothetical protein